MTTTRETIWIAPIGVCESGHVVDYENVREVAAVRCRHGHLTVADANYCAYCGVPLPHDSQEGDDGETDV